ncbi:SRPBCC family protein [Amycolatopsis sp. NPDC059090]|uniref:SRPBCC family protein n=1 Tax=unclassified Amycolatopsis TaxID=2618356 RepID=UPI00366F5B10
MLTLKEHTVQEQVLVDAPADALRRVVADLEYWVQVHRPAAHAEYLDRGEEDVIRHWAVVDDHTVRTWTERRRTGADRISFALEAPEDPNPDARGAWTFETRPGGTLVTLRYEFSVPENDTENTVALVRADVAEQLATVEYAGKARDELADLIISFEDPLFVAGSLEDAYAYLYEADKWAERIPHVSRLVLEEDTPNIQFFDMDTATADGRAHTTRSVRVCLPGDKIVYKQIRLPALLDAHTGHWLFTASPEGVVASARHTATIKPSALHLLGEGTTVLDARKYLRRVLSENSMGNLRLTKAYAEQRAGL